MMTLEARARDKHERDRAARAVALLLLLCGGSACSEIPRGRSAIDTVSVQNTKTIKAGDVEDNLATEASTKFLYLFQGVAYDYAIYDEAVLQRDMSRVERSYRSKGYFDARARVARLYQDTPRHVHVEIVVDEGPATMNRRIRIAGMEALPKPTVTAVLAAAALAVPPGTRFDEDKLKASEGAVKKALTDLGYAYATADVQAEVDIGEHVADYGFKVVPGPLCTFGAITITGLDPDASGPRKQEIPEAPLRRAINIREGTPYSTAELDSATQALLDLEVFSAVTIAPTLPQPPPPHPVVPLTVQVQPTRLREVTLGGGLEIDEIKTDLHAVTGWEDHNFMGGLRDFSVEFKPGVVLYPIRIDSLKGPLKPLPEEWLKFELKQPGLFEARTNGFIRPQFNVFPLLVEVAPLPTFPPTPVIGYREIKVPVGLDRTFFKKIYVAIDYTVQVENPFAYVGLKDAALETVILSFPELVTHFDLRDNTVRPHEGIYLGNTVQVAGGIFGGTANDVRVQPEVRTYIPVAHGVTFATRASVGFLWASNYGKGWQNELSNSPTLSTPGNTDPARTTLVHDAQTIYFRGFFSGGPTTNRGFPILGVSPHAVIPFLNPATSAQAVKLGCDPANPSFESNLKSCFLPVGGFTLWEFQNETRFDISGPLSASVFCDMSDVSPNANDIRLGHLHLSCGVGAAYDTPVGPIRLNIGYRVQPLQVLGYRNETAAAIADPTNGQQPTIFGLPLAIAIGIGQAY